MIKQIHLDECHSTQDVLKEQITQGNGTSQILISCENQTHGHGRGENIWTAMPGTLCFSMNLVPHAIQSFTALEISVLIAHFFKMRSTDLKLKWPNDILNKFGLKCAGVLIQSHQGQMMAGIGINLFSNISEFGGIYDSSFEFSKKEFALKLGHFINENRFRNTNLLRNEWKNLCAHMDKNISLQEGYELIRGRFLDIGEHGEAIVLTEEGKQHHFNGTLRVI